MNTSHSAIAVTRTAATTSAAPTVLFIHGFLDDARMWESAVDALAGEVNTVRYDLPGHGERAATGRAGEAVTLQALADEATTVLDDAAAPVIIVGHSLGSQVAELIATQHPDRVAGLMLVAPVALKGTQLPREALMPLAQLGSNTAAHRAVRAQLSPNLTELQLNRLIPAGLLVAPDTAATYVELINTGVPDAPVVSGYTGPVLVVSGGTDGFVAPPLLQAVLRRFPQARHQVIEGAGHWLHSENPRAFAGALRSFVASGDHSSAGWRQGFTTPGHGSFTDNFASDIVLDASVLVSPISGREQAAAVMSAASSIYESLRFVAESHTGTTTYLQWRAQAFSGLDIRGVTVLEHDADGAIVAASIHHRPLGAVLKFSAALRERLAGVVPAEHFVSDQP